MAWFRRQESRSLPRPENELPLWSAYVTLDGLTLTPLQALGVADCWAAVRVLADAASSLPLHVYRERPDGGRERVTGGKLVELLDRPSPSVTQADLVSTLMCHVVTWGNGYVAKFRQDGVVSQLAPLHPDRVQPELLNGEVRWRYSPSTGMGQLLTEADVIHVKGLSVDGLIGMSAVGQAGRVLGLSDQLVKHALQFFDTGRGLPTGVFKMPPESSEAQRQRAAESIRNEMVRRGVLVIEGEGEFTPTTLRLDDSQFAEQRRLSAQEVARVFRIPPHMLGAPSADSMTYSNVEQESIEFVRYSLTPWLRRIELALSNDADLAFQRQYCKFETDGLLRADAATRAQVYAAALDPIHGWMDVEEVRRLEDLPPRAAPSPQAAMAAAINQITTPMGVATNGTT